MSNERTVEMVSNEYSGVVSYKVDGTTYGPIQGSEAVFHLLLLIFGKIKVIEQKLNDGLGE